MFTHSLIDDVYQLVVGDIRWNVTDEECDACCAGGVWIFCEINQICFSLINRVIFYSKKTINCLGLNVLCKVRNEKIPSEV